MITIVVVGLNDILYDEPEYCKSGLKAVTQSLFNLVDVLSPSMNKSISGFPTAFIDKK